MPFDLHRENAGEKNLQNLRLALPSVSVQAEAKAVKKLLSPPQLYSLFFSHLP